MDGTPVKQADGFDAVVVGSGPNGLIGAVTLADAGLKVLLVEAADEFGGGLRSGPLTGLDGFTHDLCATVLPLARASAAFRGLDLDVEWAYPAVQAAHPLDGQDAVLIHRDVGRPRTDSARAGTRSPGGRRSARPRAAGSGLDSLLSPLSVPRAPIRLARYGALGILPATVVAQGVFGGSAPAPRSPGWPRTRWSICAGRSPPGTGCCWPRWRTRSAGRWSAAGPRGWPRRSSPG